MSVDFRIGISTSRTFAGVVARWEELATEDSEFTEGEQGLVGAFYAGRHSNVGFAACIQVHCH